MPHVQATNHFEETEVPGVTYRPFGKDSGFCHIGDRSTPHHFSQGIFGIDIYLNETQFLLLADDFARMAAEVRDAKREGAA